MIGVITQERTKFEEKHYYLSDRLNDKNNDSWLLLYSKTYFFKFSWESMWENIVYNRHLPTVLLYARLKIKKTKFQYFFYNLLYYNKKIKKV